MFKPVCLLTNHTRRDWPMKLRHFLMRQAVVCVLTTMLMVRIPSLTAADSMPRGLPDPGTLTSLEIETGRNAGGKFVLDGQAASQQLVVTGRFDSSQLRDVTRAVNYEVKPTGVVRVNSSGLVLPLSNGAATITATTAAPDSHSTSIHVNVVHLTDEPPLNFERHIQPILTRFGCNSGGCHGKSGGQNGFALSLLGFETKDDYQRLANEGRGRRIMPTRPDQSLVLMKPSGRIPHQGGTRFDVDSTAYRTLRQWISQGIPFGQPDDPQVVRIEVVPDVRMLPLRGEQQLAIVAYFADGSTENVSGMAQYESNNKELVQVSPLGLVTALEYSGGASVMARYQGHVATFRAPIPLNAPVNELPNPKNFVDQLVFKQLKSIGLPPSELCSDEVFVRRSSIDITGRLPLPEEAERFLSDNDPLKRDRWIDTLLDKPDYADYFTRKWVMLMRSRLESVTSVRGSVALQQWFREAFYHNRPYSQIVTELLTASGDIEDNPPVNWWRTVKEQSDQVESTAQIFLGLRLQCARCHHHPFEQWSQKDYYGLAAFFSRVGRKYGKDYQANVERIVHDWGAASIPHPKTGVAVLPTGLGGKPLTISPEDDPRQALADWMTATENQYFSRALVNRYWKHFFSRGLVDPEDDMRATNPPSNPELLDALSQHFVSHGFDLKDLIRTICQSRVYQLSSEANEFNLQDKQHNARYYPRRMTAEVLLDSIDDLLMTKSFLGGAPSYPQEARAIQLPHFPYPSQYFLTIFGTPDGITSCECERIDTANLSQNLHLMNSSEVVGKVSSPTGRASMLSAEIGKTKEQKLREIYLIAFSRAPKSKELELLLGQLNGAKTAREEKAILEDILWALINTKEFMFNH